MSIKRKSELGAKCKKIERELRRHKLWGNLVPATTWFHNLRELLPEHEWDQLRRDVYRLADYRCSMCGTTDPQLHAHEDWAFDYEKAHQRLNSLVALCELCHHCQHLGFAQILIEKGELQKEKLVEHWCAVNNASEEEFVKHERLAFRLWDLRNQFRWKLVGHAGQSIEKIATAWQVFEFLLNYFEVVEI